MKKKFAYDFALFDFDGLLVDTEPLHCEAYLQMASEKGVLLDWNFSQFCKLSHSQAQGVFVYLEKEYPKIFTKEIRDSLYKRKTAIYETILESRPPSLMPGVATFCSLLQEANVPLAVVTNSPRKQIELIIRNLSFLRFIPHFITREDYTSPKPSPEGYLLARTILGQEKGRGIGFEDAKKGVEALVQAGVTAVWVSPGKKNERKEISQEVLYWDSFDEGLSLFS